MTEQDLAAIEARLKAPAWGPADAPDSYIQAGGPAYSDWLRHAPTDIAALLAEVRRLRSALEGLVDDERCQYDHHGYCQTHGIAKPCEMAVAREALGLESLA